MGFTAMALMANQIDLEVYRATQVIKVAVPAACLVAGYIGATTEVLNMSPTIAYTLMAAGTMMSAAFALQSYLRYRDNPELPQYHRRPRPEPPSN